MKFGLEQHIIDQLNNIFSHYEDIDQVLIYGSRAKGNYKNGSDIDLTILSDNFNNSNLLKVANQIDDLLLPYKIDLSVFRQISNPDLIDHINRVDGVFYDKKNKI